MAIRPIKSGSLSARKRSAILNAAVDCFAEEGFDQVSMDTIAAVAKVSKRTVYNHFSSKDILFSAIVSELKQRSSVVGELKFDVEMELAEQLSEFGSRVINFHCEPTSRRLARVILPRLVKHPKIGQVMFGDSKLFELELQTCIRAAVRAKRLRKLDPTLAARQFLGLIETFVVWPQLLRGAASPARRQRQQLVAETVAMFLARYGPR